MLAYPAFLSQNPHTWEKTSESISFHYSKYINKIRCGKRVRERNKMTTQIHTDLFFTHPRAFISAGSLESLESLRTLKRKRDSQVHQSEEKRRKVLLQQCMLGHGQTESWCQMALWVNPVSFDQEVQTCLAFNPALMHARTHTTLSFYQYMHTLEHGRCGFWVIQGRSGLFTLGPCLPG